METPELHAILGSDKLTILHACMDQAKFDIKQAHITARIKDSIYFSINEIAMPKTNMMMPSESDFIEKMKEMDVRVDDTIVCYDSMNMIIAPRVSWMMRAFGAKNVFVLNGTFLKWINEKLPLSQGQQKTEAFTRNRMLPPNESSYDFKLNPQMVAYKEGIEAENLIDARFKNIFDDAHIQGSKNIPFPEVLNTKDMTFKSKEELQKVFGDDVSQRAVLTCHKGVTACILEVALRHAGSKDTAVYDGSWSEYAGTKF